MRLRQAMMKEGQLTECLVSHPRLSVVADFSSDIVAALTAHPSQVTLFIFYFIVFCINLSFAAMPTKCFICAELSVPEECLKVPTTHRLV